MIGSIKYVDLLGILEAPYVLEILRVHTDFMGSQVNEPEVVKLHVL